MITYRICWPRNGYTYNEEGNAYKDDVPNQCVRRLVKPSVIKLGFAPGLCFIVKAMQQGINRTALLSRADAG